MSRTGSRVRRSGLLAALTLVLAAPACGSGGDSGSTATPQVATSAAEAAPSRDPSQAAVCDARDELETSVAALRGVDLATAGASGLVAAAQQVHQDLDAVGAAASAAYKPTIAALRASLTTLTGTASGVTDKESLKAAMPELTAQVAAVSASWAVLRQQMDNRCG
ncbi:hypothetical protein ACFQFC_07145 [Amorphoplanes digitatis]|uniref:Cystathionine beta-lyase/cystathionine gamma-synthase n=1 Tax=Actinoplanes digitatis TaxID=1868 RepID=A0A7W7I060_9ACTN|nr:hypothetical protein [Actinoplanes digitatis]MBB4763976.1 cystathionine beta-lyase/cystathionine gamma-synthase [Actinoplanes digitatis]BFE73277.1 hypothetical protein GCM10020092_065780 [Actinoplanes digitatis]GID93795.1 hypothetical protein Adi01nite_32070 [Actinoplanes digitatis]